MDGRNFCFQEQDIPKLAKSLRVSTVRLTDAFLQLCTESYPGEKGTLFQLSPSSQDFSHILKYMSNSCEGSTERNKILDQDQVSEVPKSSVKRIYSTTIDKWINFWYSKGLRRHRNKTSEVYKKDAKSLRSLIRGTYFKDIYEYKEYADTNFDFDDWKRAVTNFARVVKDPGIRPFNKATIKNQSISGFLYNPYIKSGCGSLIRSHFIFYLNENPIEVMPNDPYDKITDSIIELYKRHLGNGYKPNNAHKRLFIEASFKIANFFKVNARHIAYCDTDFRSDWKKAELVMKCLMDSNERILPHYVASNALYEDKLPEYLRKMGIWLN